jgi:hypothetical protein
MSWSAQGANKIGVKLGESVIETLRFTPSTK